MNGLYWTTNTFIWSWPLLPFLPLSEILKVDISTATVKEHHMNFVKICEDHDIITEHVELYVKNC